MLTITNFVKRVSSVDGSEFFSMELTSNEPEVILSKNGKYYITARRCYIGSTFTETQCKSMVGKTFPGTIQKVECDPYDFVVEETGETITRHHRYEYRPEEVHSTEEVVFS